MTRSTVRGAMTWAAGAAVLAAADPAQAQTKTLIDYFQPTPIICPLTSNTWGAPGVVPRDVCNGLEDPTNKDWQYWDGKILEGTDGKYHLYAGRWPQNKGFADWPNSVMVQADGGRSVFGSYVPSATPSFANKEQNVTGMPLRNGTFALLDSPGNVFTAASAGGPWTSAGTIQIDANGFTISKATTENQTFWQNADGSFLVIARTFQEMTSPTNILGPYAIQATIPNLQSQGYEDPVVWCSGGQYHLVANMYNARKAMHFTSPDGIHNWKNMGLAYDPTTDFVRYTDGTVNHWYKIERPGVHLENGHVTAFTFAVIDVDKALDLADDNHGSKIIVVPFDGVSFDRDNPGPGSAACPLAPPPAGDGGPPVDSGRPGDAAGGSDGAAAAGDAAIDGGGSGSSGSSGSGGSGASSGAGGSSGADSSGDGSASSTGIDASVSGASSGAAASSETGAGASGGGAGASGAGGDSSGSRGAANGGGATASSASNGNASDAAPASAGGCQCNAGLGQDRPAGLALFVGLAFAARWKRRSRTRAR